MRNVEEHVESYHANHDVRPPNTHRVTIITLDIRQNQYVQGKARRLDQQLPACQRHMHYADFVISCMADLYSLGKSLVIVARGFHNKPRVEYGLLVCSCSRIPFVLQTIADYVHLASSTAVP